MPGRIVVEVQPGRRLVREYDEEGRLVKIRIEATSQGPAEPLPKAPPAPRPVKVQPAKKSERARPPEPPAAAAAVLSAPSLVPAPPPPLPLLDIITEAFPPATPKPVVVARPRTPRVAISPTALVEDAPMASETTSLPRVEAVPAPPSSTARAVAPLQFEILAIERIAPAPLAAPPEEIQPPGAPAQAPSLLVIHAPSRRILTLPAPLVVRPPPRRPLKLHTPATPTVEELLTALAPAPLAVSILPPAPEPEPWHPVVADLDARVDQLLRAGANKPRPRRRPPVAVPRFEPLAREPWEDRLDAVLAD